jgi:hypothetical protein
MLTAASLRRMAVLSLLLGLLAVPQVAAAGLRPVSLGWLDQVLRMLHLDLKTGCKLDPNGRCSTSATQPPNTKIGCVLDPNGRCRTSKAGCILDPDGLCHTNSATVQTDIGCKLDPDGRCRQ